MRNIQSLVGCSGLLFLMAWMMASCEESFTVSELNLDLDNSTDFSCENNADCPGKLPYCSNEVCVSCDDADVEENSKDTGADCVCNKECKSNICLGQICVECHDKDIDYCGEAFRERNNDPDENPGNNGLTENLSFTCVNNTCVPSCDGENVTYCAKIKQCVKTDPQPEDACDDSCNVCQTGYACIGNQCKRSVDCNNMDNIQSALRENNIDFCEKLKVYHENSIQQNNGDIDCIVFCGPVKLPDSFNSIEIDDNVKVVAGINAEIQTAESKTIINVPLFKDINRAGKDKLVIIGLKDGYTGLNIVYPFEGIDNTVKGLLVNKIWNVEISGVHYKNDNPIKLFLGYGDYGGLIGYVENSIINNVSIEAPINMIVKSRNPDGYAGGYFGWVKSDSDVSQIDYNNDIFITFEDNDQSEFNYFGGLVGYNTDSDLSDLSFSGKINIENSKNIIKYFAGVVGYLSRNGETEKKCESLKFSGNITINSDEPVECVGGLIGYANKVKIEKGSVNGLSLNVNRGGKIGGVVGNASSNVVFNNVTVDDCSITIDGDCSNNGDCSNIGGGIGLANYSNNKIEQSHFSNVKINTNVGSNIGGVIGSSNERTIEMNQVNVTNGSIIINSGDDYNIGGMAGSFKGKINNSKVSDMSIHLKKGSYIGGLVGATNSVEINDPVVDKLTIEIDENGGNSVGGMVGVSNNMVSIFNPTINGLKIQSGNDYVGGLAGNISHCGIYTYQDENGSNSVRFCSRCYIKIVNKPDVNGKNTKEEEYNKDRSSVVIDSVSGKQYVGGVIGNAQNSSVLISGLDVSVKDSVYGLCNDGKYCSFIGGVIGYLNNNNDRKDVNGESLSRIDCLFSNLTTKINKVNGGYSVGGFGGFINTLNQCNFYNISNFVESVESTWRSAGLIANFESTSVDSSNTQFVNIQNVVKRVNYVNEGNNDIVSSAFIGSLYDYDFSSHKTNFKHVLSAAIPYRNSNRVDVRFDDVDGVSVFNLWHFYKYYFNFKYNGNDPGEESRPSTYQTHVASFNDNVHFVSFLSDGIKPKVSAEIVRNNLAEYSTEDYKIDWGLATVKFDGTDYQIPCFTDIGESKCENKSSELKQ